MPKEMILTVIQAQVTTHISSISDIFVHDGAIGSFPKIDAKVRVISDSSSAVYPFSDILWKTSSRSVSHDTCPITVYAASSISSSAAEALGLGNQGHDGFIAADAERSSLILCGKAFADAHNMKEALAALAGPIISSRGGLLLSARILGCCDSVVLLFATEDTIRCSDLLVSPDSGVVLSPHGVSPLFQNGNPGGPHLSKLPAAVILVSSDSSRVIPPVSKLSSGQVAYHFLAGYQNGKFIPAYGMGLSCIDPVELAKSLFSKLKDNQIPSFLINANEGEKRKTAEMQSFKRMCGENSKLKVFHSDPLDYHSIMDALKGCCGLFYSFEPPSDQPSYDEFMADMEVRAAHNVLEACAQTDTMDKVVFTSSATAVIWRDRNDSMPSDVDERNWSNVNFCKKFKLWHGLSKTLAERTAWALAMDRGVNMVSINGGLLMSPDLSITSPYLKGAAEMYEDGVFVTVDLRFLVDSHICVFEDISAYGRYLCFNHVINCNEEAVKLAQMLLPASGSSTQDSSSDWEESKEFQQQRISNKKLNKLLVDFDSSRVPS